jgi:uroporphyrin-III C-methyltransferase
VLVVSRVGWPDQLTSDHTVATLAEAAVLHSGRPTIVTVGAGARPLAAHPDTLARPDVALAQEAQTPLT